MCGGSEAGSYLRLILLYHSTLGLTTPSGVNANYPLQQSAVAVQGYLAHKKTPHPRTLQ